MDNQYNRNGFIPKHGGYEQLISYKKAEIIYDGTYYFCKKYLHPYDRTIDQMIQAARSGKQNIIEGSMASGTLFSSLSLSKHRLWLPLLRRVFLLPDLDAPPVPFMWRENCNPTKG